MLDRSSCCRLIRPRFSSLEMLAEYCRMAEASYPTDLWRQVMIDGVHSVVPKLGCVDID